MQARHSIQQQILANSVLWQQNHLKIINKKGELVPFRHNVAQVKVYNTLQLQRQAGLPERGIVLKARQMGISTFVEGTLFERGNTRPNYRAEVVSADTDSTDKVFGMCRIFQEEMPANAKRELQRSNRKELTYAAPHRSGILCQTAGKDVLGRGGTTRAVHATEVAFWANAKVQLNGLLQQVPEDFDTLVVIESTANGVGGEFFDRYMIAVDRLKRNKDDLNGYLPIFLPWWIFPEYQAPIPDVLKHNGKLELTDEELDYVRYTLSLGIQLTQEQVYWRRITIAGKCGGDISLFRQEYPTTAKEAFQTTGRAVFSGTQLDRLETHCCKASCCIEFYEADGTVKYRKVDRRDNCWHVWKWPNKTHRYILAGDVAEGLLSDKANVKSDPDYSAAVMLDRDVFDIPMTYHGRPDTMEYGEQMVLAGRFFNYAWASPEINSIGLAVLNEFKRADYRNIYVRQSGDEKAVEQDTQLLGWKTTSLTRKTMIEEIKTAVSDGIIRIYDGRIIDELRTFVVNTVGKPEADKGYHDDFVMALAIALQLHIRCPMGSEADDVDFEQRRKTLDDLAMIGAVDDIDLNTNDDPYGLYDY